MASSAALPLAMVCLTVEVTSLVLNSNCGRVMTEWNLSARFLKSCRGSVWDLDSAAVMMEVVIRRIQSEVLMKSGQEPDDSVCTRKQLRLFANIWLKYIAARRVRQN